MSDCSALVALPGATEQHPRQQGLKHLLSGHIVATATPLSNIHDNKD